MVQRFQRWLRGRESVTRPAVVSERDRRNLISRFMRGVIDPLADPLFYYLDLRGPDKLPSHSKIFSTISFGFGIGLLFRLWRHYFTEQAAASSGELGFLLAFSFLVFALPYGLKGLHLWASTKGGGSVGVVREAAKVEPELVKAQAALEQARAAIAARRAQTDDGTEPTP